MLNTNDLEITIYILKTFLISICTYYTSFKIKNEKANSHIFVFIITIMISIISSILKYKVNSFTSAIYLIILLSTLYSVITKSKLGISLFNIIIALGINYALFFISVTLSYIPNKIFHITNDYISLIWLMLIHIILLHQVLKMRKFKDGFIFLKNKSKEEFFDLFILDISVAILFSTTALSAKNYIYLQGLFVSCIAFAVIMFITIQKTLTMYYKHKLLVTELEETKSELANKNKEIEKLEQENLNFSKTSHSIAHRQKSLEHKLNELLLKNEVASEIDIRKRLNDISSQCFNYTATTELSRTGITEIDDMLSCMQSECIKNNIQFDLQLNGNLHTMVNNSVSKEDLEILLADHIKNAIIAINYSENVNRSILVKLGMIDGVYSFYIYDSGIEFEISTLSKLGKQPCTTHSDNGGTGMGFMNTFDTLNKYQASMYIHEIGSPTSEDFTKFIVIKFDKNHKFEINSYRTEKIKNIKEG